MPFNSGFTWGLVIYVYVGYRDRMYPIHKDICYFYFLLYLRIKVSPYQIEIGAAVTFEVITLVWISK